MKHPQTLVAFLFGLFLVLPAWSDVVVHEHGPSSLQFSAPFELGTGTLRITGPEQFHIERSVRGVSSLDLDLGDTLPEGSYRWSLAYTTVVDRDTAQAIADARAQGETRVIDELKASGLFASGTWNGSFLVLNGQMIVPGSQGPESSVDRDLPAKAVGDLPTKDFLISDDLIVDGSTCIGFDCVNGEDFGFDTLRMKENNLRIRFVDTSVGSYPSTDWLIFGNDSTAGGLDRFSVKDITADSTVFTIEGGAPAHAIYSDDAGRLGLRTSTPVTEIHSVSGDTPTLRLEQTDASGFTAQTWDVAGNEHNFFVRDVTNGSTLPLRIRPEADTNSLMIDEESQVGVGIQDPTHKFHVQEVGTRGDLRIVGKLENNGPVSLQLLDSDSGDDWVFSNKPNGFEISKGGTGAIELRLDEDGNLFIQGQLTTEMGVYPDYVFDADYELMPLDQLAAFIEAHGHLPKIKPETEVAFGKRVNLSELSRGLLEKVEELTLYTLEQHKTDQALRDRLAAQDELIRRLEDRLAALEQP